MNWVDRLMSNHFLENSAKQSEVKKKGKKYSVKWGENIGEKIQCKMREIYEKHLNCVTEHKSYVDINWYSNTSFKTLIYACEQQGATCKVAWSYRQCNKCTHKKPQKSLIF